MLLIMKIIKDQRGFALVLEFILVAAVALVIGAVGYRYWQNKHKAAPVTTEKKAEAPKAAPKPTTISERTFTLTLPVGWKAGHANDPKIGNGYFRQCRAVPNAEVPEYDYCYEDKSGNFFDVLVDPGGREIGNDVVWTLSKTTAGFKIASESKICKVGEFTCEAGDGRFHIYMPGGLHTGHNYFFEAGNIEKETGVSDQVYRDILASFKVK